MAQQLLELDTEDGGTILVAVDMPEEAVGRVSAPGEPPIQKLDRSFDVVRALIVRGCRPLTMNDSLDRAAFVVFIEQILCPQLWPGAVVVMDNLPAHKLTLVVPKIEAVGASVIYLSPYSPDFNPIELWWSQLKSFLRSLAPTTTSMIDKILAVALDLMNPKHLRNWFANCCYCTS